MMMSCSHCYDFTANEIITELYLVATSSVSLCRIISLSNIRHAILYVLLAT